MTTLFLTPGHPFEPDDLVGARFLNRLANRPDILSAINPTVAALDLTPLALSPGTVVVFHDEHNAGLFFPFGPGGKLWEGHYLFASLRGKPARDFAKQAVRMAFDRTPALAIVGQVPKEHRAARVMSRAIGCRPLGESVDDLGRACIRYILERGHG
jgi:hypothetical protein